MSGDSNGTTDLFVKDLASGAIRRVSTDAAGVQAAAGAIEVGNFSADGSRLVFTSSATTLVAGDSNGEDDVFVALNPFVAHGGGIDTVRASATVTLATNVENLVLTGSAAINGTGNTLANRITGNAANNTLNGAAGADTMSGGAGNDSYTVDHAGDRVVENVGSGTDTVNASVSHTLAVNVENLVLTGSATINGTGNTLANAITGNTANNTLDGGAGDDILSGGAGNDSYVVGSGGDSVVEAASAGTDTVRSTITFSIAALANIENVTLLGSAAIDATGNTGNNVLTGNAGNNVLSGGSGSDTASYVAATGPVHVNLAIAAAQASGAGSDTLVSIENLTGSAFADTLLGNAGSNVLDGGAGADLLAGGAGNDTYVVDSLADTIVEEAGAGTDLVQTALSYKLADNVENLTLTGSAGAAAIGNTLANVLTGNAGNNLLSGGAGSDTASFANATAVVNANLATGIATGFGSDTLVSIENLIGSSQADTLVGNAGANVLDGRSGQDTLSGGSGADTFRFSTTPSAATNADNVTDFDVVDDRIELENAVFANLTTTGALAAANFRASAGGTAADANDYVVYNTTSGQLFYDADGNGAGVAVLIATFNGAPTLTVGDIFVT